MENDELLEAWRRMLLIRRFEEETERQYQRANIGGYCHLASGQEAATVGLVGAMDPEDALVVGYRTHGFALSKGVPAASVMAELFGKASGCAGGRGGSMHLLDPASEFWGGWGIVAGQLPIASGLALAASHRDERRVVVCELGDGATNMGAWHETMNLAAVWSLPLLVVIMNNGYGMGTTVKKASAVPQLHKRAEAFGIDHRRVDGMNLVRTREAADETIARVRETSRPAVLELMTYRYRGHSVADPGKSYRTVDEVDAWKAKDPIERLGELLSETVGLDREKVGAEVDAEIADAVSYALAAEAPDASTVTDLVFGDPQSEHQFSRTAGAAHGAGRWA